MKKKPAIIAALITLSFFTVLILGAFFPKIIDYVIASLFLIMILTTFFFLTYKTLSEWF